MLAPNSEVSIFPWKEPKERIPLAVRQIHSLPQGAPARVANRASRFASAAVQALCGHRIAKDLG